MNMLTQSNFTSTVQTGVHLVDFFATWCGPCKMLAPELESLQSLMGDSLHIHKVDVDQEQQLAMQQGIQAMPTLLLFKDGQLVEKLVGFSTSEEMAEIVKPHL